MRQTNNAAEHNMKLTINPLFCSFEQKQTLRLSWEMWAKSYKWCQLPDIMRCSHQQHWPNLGYFLYWYLSSIRWPTSKTSGLFSTLYRKPMAWVFRFRDIWCRQQGVRQPGMSGRKTITGCKELAQTKTKRPKIRLVCWVKRDYLQVMWTHFNADSIQGPRLPTDYVTSVTM